MVRSMKGSGRIMRHMGQGILLMLMVISTAVTGETICAMARGPTITPRTMGSSPVSGLTTSSMATAVKNGPMKPISKASTSGGRNRAPASTTG